jgi:hypothetical protein
LIVWIRRKRTKRIYNFEGSFPGNILLLALLMRTLHIYSRRKYLISRGLVENRQENCFSMTRDLFIKPVHTDLEVEFTVRTLTEDPLLST